MKDLLLVIDVQNVYFPGQPWACPSAPKMVENIKKLLDSPACGRDFDVMFTQYLAAEDPKGRWTKYNAEYKEINEDPFLCDMEESMKPYQEKWPTYTKSTYSSCYIPEIMDAIFKYDRIILTGVVAECCILATMTALVDAGAHVCYLKDGVAGQSQEWEDTVERIAATFAPIHAEVMTTEEYLNIVEK